MCDCMLDIWAAFKGQGYADLIGGDQGICSCQPGYTWRSEFGIRSCFICPRDTYSDSLSAMACLPCPPKHISDPGSGNATACKVNPLVVINEQEKELADKDS